MMRFRMMLGILLPASLLAGCSRQVSFRSEQGWQRPQTPARTQPADRRHPAKPRLPSPTSTVQPALCAIDPGGADEASYFTRQIEMEQEFARADESDKTTCVPYEERRGPAYPDDPWRSFGRDAKEFLPMLWDDTKAIAAEPVSLVLLAASGASVALFENNGDDQVAKHFAERGNELGGWDQFGDVGGCPGLHFAVAGAMYFGGLYAGDTKTYEVSKTLLSALAINGIATVGLKYAVRTESPNGDEYGWPSGHTSSSFTLATVMYESYGPWVGAPLFAFAGFVGYERLSARNHDFSDVVGGAFLGMAIGHAVAKNHVPKIFGFDVLPYTDPRHGGVGVALHKRF